MPEYVYVCVFMCLLKREKVESPGQVEAVVSWLTWVLGTEPTSTRRAVHLPNWEVHLSSLI